jgi:ligand-binding SRPBCC domain-containing protein
MQFIEWENSTSIRGTGCHAGSVIGNTALRPIRGISHLHTETVVPASLEETFVFFSNAANLERLTPPWLNFRILTPQPIAMRRGVEIDYRIVLYGVPIRWRSVIDVWEPGVRFVDRQVRGPYRWWHHEHRFVSVAGGTCVIDDVEYLPRVAWLTRWRVQQDVERIFAYRADALKTLFT